MIRFIDLRGQILMGDEPHFAFYDTVRDRFMDFGGEQDWNSLDDFLEAVRESHPDHAQVVDTATRCAFLIPVGYFDERR